MDPDARKGRVFDVAPGRLQANGFAYTTLEDIARAADLREADVRALFGDKEGLMGELVSPLLDRLRAIAAAAPPGEPRHAKQLRHLIERYLDALVAHRLLVSVVLGDPTATQCQPVRDVRAAIAALRDALAGGPEADLDHRIRAASALGAVQAAVLELAGVEPATVRGVITDAAVAILLS
jgi:AcrR family transcriptional regulator